MKTRTTMGFSILLVLVLVRLQYRLWLGHYGWQDMLTMEKEYAQFQELNEKLSWRNQTLTHEVEALSLGKEAMDEAARTELGYVKDGEVFYRIREQ